MANNPKTPPYRRLRAFAVDPSLDRDMDLAVVNQAVIRVIWEELKPGPIGEYIEVVDYDPASERFYSPVDLNAPELLATDGLAPSDGNPKFHQQIVYAIAMLTIRNFERALGRRALWSPRHTKTRAGHPGEEYVARLRIYPHAMREANAYYSPEKKSLLFGYFRSTAAASADAGGPMPGAMVFTCLSHDVVAHEVTHALLDGMHRRFIESSNPDVLAFHEAFADIVALFQHFTFPEVLRTQIAATRGDLADQNMLGQLAQEVGRSLGQRSALRDAIGRTDPITGQWQLQTPDPAALENATEVHDRGAILVAAVFDAFLSIYKTRVADLLRIATSGSGVLPAGAIHPDLVNRLSAEAAKSAQHMLNMCIRALDYCPTVDITFGEYLRALITADFELVPDDSRGYRTAVIEAFRRRGIYPENVRPLSVESLLWAPPSALQEPHSGGPDLVKQFIGYLVDSHHLNLMNFMNNWDMNADRAEVYEQSKQLAADLHDWIHTNRQSVQIFLPGLDLAPNGPKFEIHSLRPARRVGPNGEFISELVVEIAQRRRVFLTDEREKAGEGMHRDSSGHPYDFYFRGGHTLILDLHRGEVRYSIFKSINSATRLERQRIFISNSTGTSLRATYSSGVNESKEPFAMLHRDG